MLRRNWCARVKFRTGTAEFIFGTVQADTDMEAERALIDALLAVVPLLRESIEYIYPIQGMLVFQDEG